MYPINASHPDIVITELVEDMDGMAIGQAVTIATWDMEVDECKRCIRRVCKRVKQRRARLQHKLRRRSQRQLLNRPQWILANM